MTERVVVATFESRFEAENALTRLKENGIPRDAVSLVMSEAARRREFGAPSEGAGEGAGIGGLWGGMLGALVGGLAAVGSIALPGLGLVAAGPIVAALAGAGAGGAAGTLLGTLVGLGVSETDAHHTQRAIADGKIVLAAHVDRRDAERVAKVFQNQGAEEVRTTAR
jgi:uncharacterized membrane protein